MITNRHTLQFLVALSLMLPTLSLAAGTSTATSTNSKSASSTSASTTSAAPAPTITTTTPATNSGALSTEAQTRIKKLAANISNKQDAAVRRIDNVIGRLDSRLKIMEISGSNVTEARVHLGDAKVSLAKASSSLDTIDKAVTNFIGSATPRENWTGLKATYADINTNLRAAYDAVVATLAAAATAGTVQATTGTTTASTSPKL